MLLVLPSPAAGPLGGDPAGEEHRSHHALLALAVLVLASWLLWLVISNPTPASR